MVCIEKTSTDNTAADEERKFFENERKKYLEQISRQKQEEKMARDRVLLQIDDDKHTRKMRMA